MSSDELQNPTPLVYGVRKLDENLLFKRKQDEMNEDLEDEIDALESNY
jgi:hypothetical protein